MEEVARMIAEEAGKRYPVYNRLVGERACPTPVWYL
jgi:hypothetical protein